MAETIRYTRTGSAAFETMLDHTLKALGQGIASAMGPDCLAVILGGGYGRGEGACVLRNGSEMPYNDFDLFVVTKRAMDIPESVHMMTKEYEARLGIEVDVGKPLEQSRLSTLGHELMWQDLLEGHKVLFGDASILTAAMPGNLVENLPPVEALRLLLNRGSGLLQAIIEERRKPRIEDEDFIRRNYQKCALSLGDALLIARSVYRPPLLHRRREVSRLKAVPSPKIAGLYERAAEFKVNPDASHPQPTADELCEMACLWVLVLLDVEQTRTGFPFKTADAYRKNHFIREKSQHRLAMIPRNLVKQARLGHLCWRYPREQLYGVLGILLADPKPDDATWNAQAQDFLRVWRTCN